MPHQHEGKDRGCGPGDGPQEHRGGPEGGQRDPLPWGERDPATAPPTRSDHREVLWPGPQEPLAGPPSNRSTPTPGPTGDAASAAAFPALPQADRRSVDADRGAAPTAAGADRGAVEGPSSVREALAAMTTRLEAALQRQEAMVARQQEQLRDHQEALRRQQEEQREQQAALRRQQEEQREQQLALRRQQETRHRHEQAVTARLEAASRRTDEARHVLDRLLGELTDGLEGLTAVRSELGARSRELSAQLSALEATLIRELPDLARRQQGNASALEALVATLRTTAANLDATIDDGLTSLAEWRDDLPGAGRELAARLSRDLHLARQRLVAETRESAGEIEQASRRAGELSASLEGVEEVLRTRLDDWEQASQQERRRVIDETVTLLIDHLPVRHRRKVAEQLLERQRATAPDEPPPPPASRVPAQAPTRPALPPPPDPAEPALVRTADPVEPVRPEDAVPPAEVVEAEAHAASDPDGTPAPAGPTTSAGPTTPAGSATPAGPATPAGSATPAGDSTPPRSAPLGDVLAAVDGVGPTRRRVLEAAYGDIERLADASVEEIAALRSISAPLAAEIRRHVRAHLQRDGAG